MSNLISFWLRASTKKWPSPLRSNARDLRPFLAGFDPKIQIGPLLMMGIFVKGDAEMCAAEFQDMGTHDFLIGIMLHHETMAWMLRGFLEGQSA